MTKKITIPQQNQPFRRQSSLGGNVSFRNLGGTDNNNYVVMAVVTKVYYKQGRVDFRLTNSTNHVVTETGDGMGSAPIPVDFYGYQRDGKIFGHYRPIQIGDLIAVAYLWGHKQAPIVLGVYPKDSSSYEFVAPQEASSFGDDRDEATYDYALGDQKIFPDGSLEYHSGNGKYFKTLRGKSFMLLDDSPLYEHLWVGYNDIGAFKDSDQNTINPLQEEAGDWLLVHEDNNEGSDSTDHRTRFYVNKDGTFQVVLSKSSKLDNLVILEGSKSNGFTLQQLYNVPQKGWIGENDPHKEPDIKNAQQYVKFNIGGLDHSATIEAATKDDSVEQATKLEIKDDGIYVNDKPLISSNPKYSGKTIIDDTISNSDGLNDAIKKAKNAAEQAAEQAKQAGEVAKAAGAAAEAAGRNALDTGDDIKKRIIYYASISKEKDIAIPGKYIIINTDTYIKNGTIKNAYIEDGAIDHAKIANEAVWSSQIANLAVTRAKIADAAIGSAQIEDLAVTDEKVGKLTFDHMVGATLDAGQINVINLKADSIVAGTITADKLNIKGLSDITSNAGTISKGRIQAGDDPNSGVVIDNLDADNPNKYTPAKKAFLLSEVKKLNSAAEAAIDYGKQTGVDYSAVEKAKQAMDDGLAPLLGDMATTTEFDYNKVIKLEQDLQDAVNAFHSKTNSDIMAQIGTTADGKNAIYRGANDPVTMGVQPHENDMWLQILSNGTYNIRVWDGAQWINPGLADIKAVSDSLSNLPKSYYQAEEPVGDSVHDGDTWYKLTKGSDGKYTYVAYKREGNSWTPLLNAGEVSNQSSINTLQNDLEQARELIKDDYMAGIAAVQEDVNSATAAIQQAKANATSEAAAIRNQVADVANNVSSVKADVASATSDVANLKVDVQANSAAIIKTNEAVSAQSKSSSDAINELKIANGQVESIAKDAKNNATVAKQTADSATALAQDAKNNAVLATQTATSATVEATNASSAVAKAELSVNGLTTRVNGIEGDTKNLSGRVASTETILQQTKDQLLQKADKSVVDQANNLISQLSAEQKTMAGQISQKVSSAEYQTLRDKVNNLQAGGDNLISDGDASAFNATPWGNTNFGKHEFYYNGTKNMFVIATSAKTELTSGSNWFPVKAGQQYILYFNGFMSNNVSSYDVWLLGKPADEDGGWTNSFNVIGGERLSPSRNCIITRTFTVPNDWNNYVAYVRFDNNGSTDGQDSVFFFNEVSLKEGNINTGYSPSPDDAIASIEKNTTAIDENSKAIKLKADQTEVDNVKNTASYNSSRLDVMNNEIKSKVSSTDVNNIVDSKGYATQNTVQSLIDQKAGTINESITNLTTELKNNNGGGVNLVSGTIEDIVVDDTANTGTQGWCFNTIPINADLKVGDKITVSVEDVTMTGRGDLSKWGVTLYSKDISEMRANNYEANTGKNTQVTITVTSMNDPNKQTALLIYSGRVSDTEGKKAVFHHLKVERGSIATPWTPAPSDNATVTQIQSITASIDGLKSIVVNKDGIASMINQKADSIEAGITGKLSSLNYGGLVLDKNGATLTSGNTHVYLNGTNGFQIQNGTSDVFHVDRSGSLTMQGNITGGNITGVNFTGNNLTLAGDLRVINKENRVGHILLGNTAVLDSQGLSLRGGGLSISDASGRNLTTHIDQYGTFITNKGVFNGSVTATSLTIPEGSQADINVAGNFRVDNNGNVTAKSITITGNRIDNASKLATIEGANITGNNLIQGNIIIGNTITGGTINGSVFRTLNGQNRLSNFSRPYFSDSGSKSFRISKSGLLTAENSVLKVLNNRSAYTLTIGDKKGTFSNYIGYSGSTKNLTTDFYRYGVAQQESPSSQGVVGYYYYGNDNVPDGRADPKGTVILPVAWIKNNPGIGYMYLQYYLGVDASNVVNGNFRMVAFSTNYKPFSFSRDNTTGLDYLSSFNYDRFNFSNTDISGKYIRSNNFHIPTGMDTLYMDEFDLSTFSVGSDICFGIAIYPEQVADRTHSWGVAFTLESFSWGSESVGDVTLNVDESHGSNVSSQSLNISNNGALSIEYVGDSSGGTNVDYSYINMNKGMIDLTASQPGYGTRKTMKTTISGTGIDFNTFNVSDPNDVYPITFRGTVTNTGGQTGIRFDGYGNVHAQVGAGIWRIYNNQGDEVFNVPFDPNGVFNFYVPRVNKNTHPEHKWGGLKIGWVYFDQPQYNWAETVPAIYNTGGRVKGIAMFDQYLISFVDGWCYQLSSWWNHGVPDGVDSSKGAAEGTNTDAGHRGV